MIHLRAKEKYAPIFDNKPYVVVSVLKYEDEIYTGRRLHRFPATLPISEIVSILKQEYNAVRVDYQPFLFFE